MQPNTQKMYRLAKGHVERFAIENKYTLSFDSITPKTIEAFINYLRVKGLVNASIGGAIKNLKVFCKWAQEHGHTDKVHYKS